MPARRRLVETLRDVDLRLVASGHVHQRRDFTFGRTRHVWSPSTGFIISDAKQERIGLKDGPTADIPSLPNVVIPTKRKPP
jgi:hypothetical protein